MNAKWALQQMVDSFADVDIQAWETVLEHNLPLQPGTTLIVLHILERKISFNPL